MSLVTLSAMAATSDASSGIVVPHAAQHEVVRCRCGTSLGNAGVSSTNKAPCVRRTAARCGAHGATLSVCYRAAFQ